MKNIFDRYVKALILLTITIFLAACPFFTAYAESTGSGALSIPSGKIICIAANGGRCEYPEGSLKAVQWSEQFGYVSVDVKVSKDGIPFISADDDMRRMFSDAHGKAVNGRISETDSGIIRTLYLRQGSGTKLDVCSDYNPCELSECLEGTDKSKILFVRTCADDFAAVFDYLSEKNMTDRVCFRFTKESTGKIIKITEGLSASVCGNYQGNIIFLAARSSRLSFENGLVLTELGSANGHGVLYDNFLMKRFRGKETALVSMVNGRCGKRTDDEMGWDDLIKRGYRAIETNYPDRLNDYINKTGNAKSILKAKYDTYCSTDIAPYSTDTEVPFTNALKNAEKALSSVTSFSVYDGALYDLENTYNMLEPGHKKPAALKITFTPGRVIAAVSCGGAILVSQILLYRQRKKED